MIALDRIVVVEDDSLANPAQIVTLRSFRSWLRECCQDWAGAEKTADEHYAENEDNYTSLMDWLLRGHDGSTTADRLSELLESDVRHGPEICHDPIDEYEAIRDTLTALLQLCKHAIEQYEA
jgi:hypothetical protein